MPLTGKQMIEEIRKVRPNVAIVVTRTIDPLYRWDGDGPDPTEALEDGYRFAAYDVLVEAVTVHGGRVLRGNSGLGGSYFRDDEAIGEVHGYLPQMIEEAVDNLQVMLLNDVPEEVAV